jgi:hypothetical protein
MWTTFQASRNLAIHSRASRYCPSVRGSRSCSRVARYFSMHSEKSGSVIESVWTCAMREARNASALFRSENSSKTGASYEANGSYGRRNSVGVACTKRGLLLPEIPFIVQVLVHGVKAAQQVIDYKRRGSPAWIRTTIHGSKGRCPTIRRPGKMQVAFAVVSVTQARDRSGGNQSKSNRPTIQRTFSSFEDCACHRTGLAPTSIVAAGLS